MTAEEYIIEKVKEQEDIIDDLKMYNGSLEKRCDWLESELKFICGLIKGDTYDGQSYYELTVWEYKDAYSRLDKVMATFGSEKQCEEE